MSAPDVTVVQTAIGAALAPIAAVGGAVLLVLVSQWIWRVLRAAAHGDAMREAFHDEFMMEVCPACGGDTAMTDDPEIEGGLYCRDCSWAGEDVDDAPSEVDDDWDRYEAGTYECAVCGERVALDEDTCQGCGNQEIPY